MELSDWTELDAVTRKIANLEDRLTAARSAENHGLVQLLEKEIAGAQTVLDRMLSEIAASITSTCSVARRDPPSQQISASSSGRSLPRDRPEEGMNTVWNRVSRTDLERIKRDLQARRCEMLARQAEELKALDAEAAEIEELEQAVDQLFWKFNIGGAEVVPLDRTALSQAS